MGFGIAAAFAIADWYAVATRRTTLEYVCKPATALAFLASAIVLDPTYTDTRAWFCVALAFCAAGDTFLMLPRDAFVPGLSSFLVAQLCFTVGFALHIDDLTLLVIGVLVVTAIAVPLSSRFVRALRRDDLSALVPAVLAYVAAISAMAATAIATGNAVAMAGAALFFCSDALIAETRFVQTRSWGPLAVIVTYHLALSALVLSLVA